MNVDMLFEAQPRPATHYERLMDLFAELASRTGQPLNVTLTMDADTFAALEADQRRPGKPKGEWCATRERALVWFERKDES